MNIKNYGYKWDNIDWFADPTGSDEIKKKLDKLKRYLTHDRKRSMSKYEVRLYEWILKKQYKADPIELIDWAEEVDPINHNVYKTVNARYYYLGYYNPPRKIYSVNEYTKEQHKNRARFHSKMK
jgi:hypothetical protein